MDMNDVEAGGTKVERMPVSISHVSMDVNTCTDSRESTCMLEVGRAHCVQLFLLGSRSNWNGVS